MTWSILAHEPETGEFGLAVATRFFAVGALCAYGTGGVGAISTRPIPVIDPDNRGFDWETNIAFNAGIGLHIFFNRWLAATLEVRDYVFNDKLENTNIPPGSEQDPDTWYGETQLTNNVQAQLGISIFFPLSFEYRLPK